MSAPIVFLASNSPRRAELLQQIGVSFKKFAVEVDESSRTDESVQEYVVRIATNKAVATLEQLLETESNPLVLAADTTIALDGDIIGKPASESECQCILRNLSDRQHSVFTAVVLARPDVTEVRLSESRVSFRSLTETEIKSYCNTAEPKDKAGAYAIQGKAAVFISRLEGSYSAVMGLPIFETAELLQTAGIEIIKS